MIGIPKSKSKITIKGITAMTIFFASRAKLRAFASKKGKKVDNGCDAPVGKRYAFVIGKGE